ncbi:hypothetical protein F4692_001893 [Nocardioides cavernae]|uniref:Uncharacterized protein n=1 Tax=Nocardioides cavernae TaxID=1921566 RepID=A0A7Y9KRN6_9ACTN|nr:hypothetical protein [Nocardioides cavernae]NYE36760.1 hypothetical protein [Nocardioides cavernae]
MSQRTGTDGPHDDPQTHLDTDPVNRPDEPTARAEADADADADAEEDTA